MLKFGLPGAVALSVSLFASTAAMAADLAVPVAPPSPAFPIAGWELRAGGYAHDPTSPEKGSADFNGEVIFPKFYSVADPYWNLAIPRLALGGTANFVGKTSQAYADLVWTFDLPYRFFIEGQFGGSVNNGKGGVVVPPGYNKLGCNAMFHESGSIGYRLSEAWSIMGTVEHTSNAGFCDQNRGLTNYGVRLGYRF